MINIEAAREIANNMAGMLDLLANLHATIAVHDREAAALAATFAMLHERADRLKEILS